MMSSDGGSGHTVSVRNSMVWNIRSELKAFSVSKDYFQYLRIGLNMNGLGRVCAICIIRTRPFVYSITLSKGFYTLLIVQ